MTNPAPNPAAHVVAVVRDARRLQSRHRTLAADLNRDGATEAQRRLAQWHAGAAAGYRHIERLLCEKRDLSVEAEPVA